MRKRKMKTRVVGRIDMSYPTSATVTIEPGVGLISVRPYRRHREYTLPLDRVAQYIVATVVRAELNEKKKGRRRSKISRGLL